MHYMDERKPRPDVTVMAQYWTTRTACIYFGVTDQTLMRWRSEQNLPHIVVPGNARPIVLFDPESLERWASDREHGGVFPDEAYRWHRQQTEALAC